MIFHLQLITKSQNEINCMHKRTKIKQMVTRSMPWKTVSSRWRAKAKGAGEVCSSLRKQLTFGDTSTGFPIEWRLINKRRNSILMTCHYPDLGSAFDWSCRMRNLIQLIMIFYQLCQAYYRRASAYMALGKFKLSLKDYEIVGTSPVTGEIFFSMFRDIPFSRKFTIRVTS